MKIEYEINKNYFIEASAGTGKTFNIIRILSKLVSEGKKLNRLLVVTYTEKAVEELRNRVINSIDGAKINDIEIYTMHSFCQRSIKEFCASCGKPINLSLVSDDDASSFVNQYVRDNDIYQDIVNCKNRYNALSIEGVKDYLLSLLNNYYLDKFYKVDKKVVSIKNGDKLIDDLLSVNSYYELKEVNNELYQKIEILNDANKSDKVNELYKRIVEIINSGVIGFCKKLGQKNDLKKDSDALYIYDYLSEVKAIDVQYVYGFLARKYIDDLYKLWQSEKEKREEQSFSDMIRYVREEIMNNGPIKAKLQEKYDYGIIDEFQDTNTLQWDIFKNLFIAPNHNLIVVGDKKQSIYSFQGADVYVYCKAIKEMEDCSERIPLEECFRSSEAMIKATNELFKTNNFIDGFNDSYYPNYEDVNERKEALLEGKEFKAIWAFHDDYSLFREQNYARVAVSKIIYLTELINNKTRLQISNGEGGMRNVTYKDFTILSRTRSEIPAIKAELKKTGIPFVSYKDNSLFVSRECAHFVALLDAIDCDDFTGNNRKVFKRALFTDFFGLSVKDISDDKYNRDDIKEMRLIESLKELAKSHRYEDFVEAILNKTDLKKRLSSINDIQSISIFEQIGDYAIDYLSDNHTIRELIRKLESLSIKNSDADEDDEDINLVGRGTNFDCVQIMTIHASKGLEFPVVIFVGNLKGPYNNDKSHSYLVHDENNNPIIELESSDKYELEQANEWRRLYYVAFTRARYLLMLPLYNRIGKENEDSVYNFFDPVLTEFMKKDDYVEVFNFKDFNYNLSDEIEKVKETLKQNLKRDLEKGSVKDQKERIGSLIKEVSDKKTKKHSYSSLSHGDDDKNIMLEESDEEVINKEGDEIASLLSDFDNRGINIKASYDVNKEPVELSSDYPKGATIGTALHEIFELLDFNSFDDETLYALINDSFTRQNIKIKDEWLNDTSLIIKNVLNSNVPVIHGNKFMNQYFHLKDITNENKKAEMEFNFNFYDEKLKDYCNGFIDLLFKNGEYYSILDWKSDKLNDEDLFSYSNFDDLVKHTNNRYSIQRVLYSYTLIKWLKIYYPTKSEEEIFNDHFGGIYYVYIRGCNNDSSNGVFAKTWNSFGELEKSFMEILNNKVGGKR